MNSPKGADFDAAILRASELYWKSADTDSALALLSHGVKAGHLQSYVASVGWLQAAERDTEARSLCERLLADAHGQSGAIALITACEANVFMFYPPYDQDLIMQGAFIRLAKQGNRTVQLELAIHYLRGTKGFPQSDEQFEHWVRHAAKGERFGFDATCHHVEFLISRKRRVHYTLIRKLETEALKRPRWKKLHDLLNRSRQRPTSS